MNYTDPSGHKSTKLKDWKKIRKYTMTKEAKKALEDYTIAGLIKLFDKSGVFLKYLAKGASKYLAAKAFYKKLKYKICAVEKIKNKTENVNVFIRKMGKWGEERERIYL